jgi:2-polyprenyl-6-methoxyphenol hydroxylase-like FAD-dependent oxidoreductase
MAVDYDIITVGGGLGGAALAKSMAERGYKVLVVERETRFKDRVRGEQMATWGVEDVRKLGIYDLLVGTCAHEMRWWNIFVGSMQVMHRDLTTTTPQELPNLTFFHPELQETLLSAAATAGAEVWRGARVSGVQPGMEPVVNIDRDGEQAVLSARLVVAADGRNSPVRKWGGFETKEDPERLEICGLLFEQMAIPEDAAYVAYNPITLQMALQFPQGNGRVRSYTTGHRHSLALQGKEAVPRFIEESVKVGTDRNLFEGARPSGPLATFNGADSFVPHPYRDGVALIGDAAATSDPCWGQGLSLTVRDARLLRDELVANEDWDAAGHKYAEGHDRDFGAVHTVEDWFTQIFYDPGPEAGVRRAKVLTNLEDPEAFPDIFQIGPDNSVVDEAARRRFFAEE